MQIGVIVGQAISTVKHATMNGWRLVVVQPLALDGTEDSEPLLAIDSLGARTADRVILSNDGAGARALVGARNSPVRWLVLGICDA